MRIDILCLIFLLIGNIRVADTPEGNFAIYLPAKRIPVKKISNLNMDISKIKLKKCPLIDDSDLISYSLDNHAMELKADAHERLMKLKIHTVFIVCVGRKPVYWGVIWTSGLSAAYPGIIIDIHEGLRLEFFENSGGHLIKIKCGYPTEEYFQGTDLRGDKRIIDALRKSGKLKE